MANVKDNSVSARKIKALRDAYFARWNRSWPHDDAYLAELWREEVKTSLGIRACGQPRYAEAQEGCLTVMRECHEFTPDPLPCTPSSAGLAAGCTA